MGAKVLPQPKMKARLSEYDSYDDIPVFANEADEAEWWATHGPSEKFFRDNPDAIIEDYPDLPPPRPRTSPVSVRFDASTVRRLRAVAERKHKGYQTLLKEFVLERLYEEEKREGIIPS